MMTLEPHSHIKEVRSEVDEYGIITVIVTDLIMNRDDPHYDKAAIDELTKHLEAWQAEGTDRRVTIEGPAS